MSGVALAARRPAGGSNRADVVNVHGFGAGPGTMLMFLRLSPVTLTVNVVDAGNTSVWISARTVSPAAHCRESVIVGGGVTDRFTELMSIGSLNVITMDAARLTPTAPSAGSVSTIVG